MELKTKIEAEEGKQELRITREFDLPLELLFRAFTEPEIFEQWMGTKVLKFDIKKHGAYQFETSNPQGEVVLRANGVIHEYIPNHKITRTFEIENSSFAVQLEFYEFEKLDDYTSRINMQIIYKSQDCRDQMLQLPFAHGLNMAHNRLQDIVSKLNK